MIQNKTVFVRFRKPGNSIIRTLHILSFSDHLLPKVSDIKCFEMGNADSIPVVSQVKSLDLVIASQINSLLCSIAGDNVEDLKNLLKILRLHQ